MRPRRCNTGGMKENGEKQSCDVEDNLYIYYHITGEDTRY